MSKIKGPAIFLAQFMGDEAPFNHVVSMAKWAADLGYKGIQVPTNNPAFFDLELAATSQDYCDDIQAKCRAAGVEITELSTHLQGQLVAVIRLMMSCLITSLRRLYGVNQQSAPNGRLSS